MKIHRFYTGDRHLTQDFWLKDSALLNQWVRVLRFRPGQQLVLFDGKEHDRLYKITELNSQAARLELITEYQRSIPQKNIYLFWSLLKKDKNDWILQKCTELGVSHFIPLLADRSEKTGFNAERAQKIIIEAAEQCGRSDIPAIHEPLRTAAVIEQYAEKVPLLICEQGDEVTKADLENLGLLVGPEGGWSDAEKSLFKASHLPSLSLHNFTLRAETACVAAVARLG